jgi:hypothetical protein
MLAISDNVALARANQVTPVSRKSWSRLSASEGQGAIGVREPQTEVRPF